MAVRLVVVVVVAPRSRIRPVRPDGDILLAPLHAAPEAGEADPVAEGVDEDAGVDVGGAEEDQGRVPAEEGGVGELEDAAQQDR